MPPVMDQIDVLGIGNALVDVLVEVQPQVLLECGLGKGSMMLMDLDEAERIHARVGPGIRQSGGSAANTTAGLASFGARAGFIGVVAGDDLGTSFVGDLRSLGVEVATASRTHQGRTGRSLILVSPDADRTMCTSLGVAAELGPDDLDESLIARASVTYLEGYLFDEPAAKDAFRQAIKVAHGAGRRAAMSLSDPFCVERHRDDFAELVSGPLDVLFGNEQELLVLTGAERVEDACRAVRRPGLVVTVTLGAQGALVFDGLSAPQRVPAVPVDEVVDTTGAGDLYAAGFLYGYTRQLPLERCAQLGAVGAAEIISHVGARPEEKLAERAGSLLG